MANVTNTDVTYYVRAGFAENSDSEGDFEFNGKAAKLFIDSEGNARVHHVLSTGISKKPVALGRITPSGVEKKDFPHAFMTLTPQAKGVAPTRWAMWYHNPDDQPDEFWVIKHAKFEERRGKLFRI